MNNSLEIEDIHPVNIKLLIAGFTMLLLGVFLYLYERRPDQVFFIYAFRLPSFYNPEHLKIFGNLSSSLPSFLHVCSFSLLTFAFLPSQSKINIVITCMSWTVVNILFEIGQSITSSTMINIPYSFFDNRAFRYVIKYFQNGTFDFIDIIFAICGGFFAYCVLILTSKGGYCENRSIKVT